MKNNLWAPWRMDYIRTPKDNHKSCVLCEKIKSSNDIENLVVFRGDFSFIILNLYPYNNGHLLVIPYEHCDDFSELSTETQIEMMNLSSRAMKIMKSKMNAEGFNFGANFGSAGGAGIDDHIHLHIVPRWDGDTNFMPVLGHTKVQVDGLIETRNFLAKHFK
jgi:ATP adenylyltransferase